MTQETGNDVNYIRLVAEVIPEIRIFDFGDGLPFITPRFPHLRFPIHTGFDNYKKHGMVPLKHMLVPSGETDNLLGNAKITGKTPLMGELLMGGDGLPVKGKIMTNEEVEKSDSWPVYTSILRRQYLEVEGVGVIF